MWHRTVFLLALLPALTATTAGWGQDHEAGNLISRSSGLRLEIVLGRLTAVSTQHLQTRTTTSEDVSTSVRESLSLMGGPTPSLHYQRIDAQQQLTVTMIDGDHWNIYREPVGQSPLTRLRFEQPVQGDLLVAVGSETDQHTYTAPSLWHLLLAQPDVCRQHLVPVLQWIGPQWQLLETTRHIEDMLCHDAEAGRRPDRQQMAALVAQLSSPRFQQRQAAHRQLRELGLAALPYLNQLDPHQLDAEQRLRIRQIGETLSTPVGDTPERIAAWLIDDSAIWQALSLHEQPAKQQTAAQQLLHR